MTHRFQVLEQLAFSLVTLFGLMCFAVVVYGYSPDARSAVHAAMQASSQFPVACTGNPSDTCVAYLVN
jgi:hypothetical protein